MRGRWAAVGLVICWFFDGILAADPPPASQAKPGPMPEAGRKPDAKAPPGDRRGKGDSPHPPGGHGGGVAHKGTNPHSSSILISPYRTYWYGLTPWDGWYPPYGQYGYYLPPMFAPADALFGPEAVKRFLGVQDSNTGPRTTIIAPGAGMVAPMPAQGAVQPAPAEPKMPPEAAPRAANAETRALARRFIGFGDMHFANGRFGEAYQRYRKAAEIMPELAEAFFRQGFALIGAGRYELAAKVMKRGLVLDPRWPKSGFRLADLYAGNEPAKAAHIETLAAAAETNPNNADLLFLLGMCLFFDGTRDRAAPFFERAVQLDGPRDHLLPFLEPARK